jgi:hypothetical protein
VAAAKPQLLVELGTHNGLSYFIFCQSVKDHNLDTLCYAVDTWEGDDHSGHYDESIYQGVVQHNREYYHGFSYLLRMRFDEALNNFRPESIDLLHIDGYHTYDAVARDFKSWYEKVRPGGIILLHDVAARLKDQGVWRFWEDCGPRHASFQFDHGFGLGIIRKSGGPKTNEPLLKLLFESDQDTARQLRLFYVHASRFHDLKRKVGTGKFGKIRQKKVDPAK